MFNDVTILLPALNEEKSIGKVIDDIRKAGYQNIIVIDNDSADKTQEIAVKHGAVVINETNRGKGNAIRSGKSRIVTPYVVMMDSDFTYPARYIRDIVELLQDYDVVIAERHIRSDNSMSLTNLLGNRLISLFGSILYWYWCPDICTGMWGFKREVICDCLIKSKHFTLEAELFANARLKKHSIARIPIAYRARAGGRSHIHVKNGIEIAWYLLKRRFWHGSSR
jgi:dolichol-phosphate mannosyltransferase